MVSELLGHESVLGFLSHCGWNSVLESVCAGVPILGWPLAADQHMNVRMVVEEIKVGLRVETCNGSVRGFVTAEGVAEAVAELMVGARGKEVRERVKKVEEMAKRAVEDDGSSWKNLDKLIRDICNRREGEDKKAHTMGGSLVNSNLA